MALACEGWTSDAATKTETCEAQVRYRCKFLQRSYTKWLGCGAMTTSSTPSGRTPMQSSWKTAPDSR